jgi:hypothetical protein
VAQEKNEQLRSKKNPVAKELRSRRYRSQVVKSNKLYNRKKERIVTLKAAATKED